MKLLALLFLVGFAASSGEWEWNTGKDYVFEYKGRLITGFPKLATQYSGLGLRAKIVIRVLEPDHLVMIVEEPKSVEVNDILKTQDDLSTYGPEGTNWRHLELPSAQPVPEEFRKFLSLPVVIRFAYDGEVTRMVFEEMEPEWSINFKKGLISLFQTKMNRFSMEIEENRMEELSLPLNGTNTWKVKEQSIDGICENQYSLSQLPKFYIKEHPETVPLPEACQNPKRLFRITKLRNTDNCEKRSLYSFFKPGYFNCRGEMGANCSPMWSRSSYTTYIACQTREVTPSSLRSASEWPSTTRRLVIQSVVNEAELSSNLFGYSTEKIVTGNRQLLKLVEVKPHSSSSQEYRMPSGSSGRTETNLMYEFDRHDLTNKYGNKALMSPEIVSKTNQYIYAKGAGVHIPKEEIISQIEELLNEVARDLKSTANKVIEAHVNMKLLGVAKGLAMLEEPGMFMEIFAKISHNPIMVNLFFDTATISGTPVAIEFLKDMMMSGKMNRLQKAQFFMWMPQYLVSPTVQILRSLFDLVRSKAIQGSEVSTVVRGLAYSSLSRLIHTACISEDRLNTYPTWVYGEFCSPDSDIVNNMWVPFLEEKIRSGQRSSTERNVAIMSLGLVGKKTVVPILVKVIQGYHEERSMRMPTTARQLALYSLVSVGYREPKLVTPILVSILKDPSETLEMRVASFNGLMKMGPPSVHILNDIVGMTHQEVGLNPELLKVINTGLYSAGHQELHSNMEFRTIERIRNAKMAYHMVRKVKGIYPTSATFFTNTFLERLGLGYDTFLTYIRSQESFLPKQIYAEIKYLLLNFNIKPIEMGLTLGNHNTPERFHEKLAEVLASKEKLQEAIQEHLTQGLNNGWNKIVQHLKQDAASYENSYEGEYEKEDIEMFVKVFESSFLYFNFDSLTSSDHVRQMVQELLHQIKSGQPVTSARRIEIQRVMDLVPFMVTIPSDMGFPINIRLHFPMTFSFSGDVKTHLTSKVQSLDISGKVAFASQLTGYVGTFSPFSKEFICTGVDQHSVVDLPGQIHIKANIPDQKLSVDIRRLDAEGGQSELDMVHFHVIPFTVKTKLTSLKPLVKSPHFKPIESNMKPYEKEITIGEPLGLALKLKYKTESAFKGLSSVWELMSVYKKCPWNMLAFGWVSPALTSEARPSIRKHQFVARLDTSASSTKEVKMEFKLGHSSKLGSSSPYLYHRLHVLSEAEALSSEGYYAEGVEGHESPIIKVIKKYLPYRLRSETLEQAMASHPKRVQKIKKVLEKMELEQEDAQLERDSTVVSLISTVTLMGPARPLSWTYSAALGFGGSKKISSPRYMESRGEHKNLKMIQNWSMMLEGFSTKQMCINGYLKFPILPMWNINDLKTTLNSFELKNTLGFGDSDCSESSIETIGRFVASEKQQKYGLKSLEAEECLKLTHLHSHSRHSVCKQAIKMATTVDVVEIDNKFRNVKPVIFKIESRIVNFWRGYLWPYLVVDNKRSSSEVEITGKEDRKNYETKTMIQFHTTTPSFDLVIKRPAEELRFENIHILSPYRIFFPLKTGRRVDTLPKSSKFDYLPIHESHLSPFNKNKLAEEYEEYEMMESLRDDYSSPYYRCKATPDYVKSYLNKTIPYKQYIGCEHLLTGDCGKVKHFFISEMMHKDGRKTVKVHLRDTKVEFIGKGSFFQVMVDGQEVRLFEGSEVDMKVPSGKIIGRIAFKTGNDYPLKIMLPKYYLDEILFDGSVLEIRPSPTMRDYPMCGLCGNLKSLRHMPASQICQYSTPELTIASHRIESAVSNECPRLEDPLREQLKLEKELCLQNSLKHKSHISYHNYRSFEVAEDQCSILKHIIINEDSKVCISKIPLLHCGFGCKPARHVEKAVPFVCLPEGRMANYYVEKVKEGKTLNELHSMEESFVKEMRQVHHCISY